MWRPPTIYIDTAAGQHGSRYKDYLNRHNQVFSSRKTGNDHSKRRMEDRKDRGLIPILGPRSPSPRKTCFTETKESVNIPIYVYVHTIPWLELTWEEGLTDNLFGLTGEKWSSVQSNCLLGTSPHMKTFLSDSWKKTPHLEQPRNSRKCWMGKINYKADKRKTVKRTVEKTGPRGVATAVVTHERYIGDASVGWRVLFHWFIVQERLILRLSGLL